MKKRTSAIVALAFFFMTIVFFGAGLVVAATNISSNPEEHWAWNDVIGWINFHETNTVAVTSQKIEGYASSSFGEISLDCATTSAGNICGTSDYKVINDGAGALSGWGWNDTIGWISFCGGQSTSTCPGNIGYRVLIDGSGVFADYAWNDLVGWISFCGGDETSSCPGVVNYNVITSWFAAPATGSLDSSTFDTGVSGGVQLNSLLWRGSLPLGTVVRFQLATATSTAGPWEYKGPDGTSNTFYTPQPGESEDLHYTLHGNNRYFRYRAVLLSNEAQTLSPRVDEVIVNWSP